MKVDVYSHSFMVSELSERQKLVLDQFSKGLIQYEWVVENGRKYRVAARVFASAFAERRYYRYHVNLLEDFKNHLAYHQVLSREIEWTHHEIKLTEDFKTDYVIKDLPPPRDPQPAIIDHICNYGNNKIVTLQTGKGKTHLTKCAISRLGLRSVFFMKGSYIDRWIPDMENSFDFKKGELLVVRGSVALNSIMEMALEDDFTAKATFISINTFSEYLRDFERKGVSQLYPIEPGRFFEVMKFGIGVFDEGHQFPHQVMKLFTYMNVNKFVTLSATLDTMDPFMANMYNLMYPREQRFNAGYYDAFIQVRAINYQMRRPKAIRHTGWGGAYSHNTFEASMMSSKNKVELKNYLDLINYYVYERFVNVMEKGQKMLVFCGTIKFCTLLTKYLQKLYPKLKVARYVSKDKMSVMEDADIIVSTVLSAGTAVDIPNLRVSLMTTAIDSQQSNEQTLGRTRKLKDWPDVTPEFYYFVCTSIDKHVTYDKHKRDFFKSKVKSHGTEQAPIVV